MQIIFFFHFYFNEKYNFICYTRVKPFKSFGIKPDNFKIYLNPLSVSETKNCVYSV